MISSNLSEAEEYLLSLSDLNNETMSISQDLDASSDEVEIVRELKVTLDWHECDLCCSGTFLVDKLLRFGGLEDKFACEVCLKSFKSKAKAVAHARQHQLEYSRSGESVSSQVVCCKTGVPVLECVTETRVGTKETESDKSGLTEKPFSCNQCNKKYKSAKGLKRHCDTRHSYLMQSEYTNEGGMSAKRARTENVISTKEPLVFICDICQEKFKTEIELKKHDNQCNSVNSTMSELDCNVTGSSPVTNGQTNDAWIGAMTIDANAFENGMLAVSFSCSSCQSKFPSEKKLKKHFTKHHVESRESTVSITNGESSTVANTLQNSASITVTTTKHSSESSAETNSNHSSSLSSNISEYWSCDKCLIKCKSEKGLKRHNTLQHGETHFCHVCGTNFKSSKMFMQHCKKKSCVPPTTNLKSCPGCHKSFFFKRSFDDHVCSLDSD